MLHYTEIITKNKKDYDAIAQDFSQKRSFMWSEIKPLLEVIKSKDKVLDVGCGNGRLYQALKDKQIAYLGVDFSKELIKLAYQQYPGINFKIGDVLDAKTWQGITNFNVAVCLAVLHTFPNNQLQKKILKRIYQALKPDGYLIISVWDLYQPKFFKLHLRQLWWKVTNGFKFKWLKVPYKIIKNGKLIKQVDRFYYGFTKKELENLLVQAGFTLIKREYNNNLCLLAKKP